MFCEYCLEEDQTKFHKGLCRSCVSLRRFHVLDNFGDYQGVLKIPFSLTGPQIKAQNEINAVIDSQSVYLEAVCGAGKTEICLGVVERYLDSGKVVAWATPRRELALELHTRLSEYFKGMEIGLFCEGYALNEGAPFHVITTHQAYRFHQSFDLVVLDEPDAFPFHGNKLLENVLLQSCVGHVIYISATYEGHPDLHPVSVCVRPNGSGVPLPVMRYSIWAWFHFINQLWRLRGERVLIYVPTMKIGRYLSIFLKCDFMSSKALNKEQIIEGFRSNRKWLVTTTILERGVTFSDVFVCVLEGDHRVFTYESLVQICGRVMRGSSPNKGVCYIFSRRKTVNLVKCMQYHLDRVSGVLVTRT